MAPQQQRDHVLLHGSTGVANANISGLAASLSAARWDSIIHNAPNVTPHKVLDTDLLAKAEVVLVTMLRPLMIQRRFAPSEHISHAVELFLYEEMPPPRRTALQACLTDLCIAVGITLEELCQFETLAQWAREVNSCCLYPLRDRNLNSNQLSDEDALAAARVTVTTSPEFQAVRASSLLLVSVLEGWLHAPPALAPAP